MRIEHVSCFCKELEQMRQFFIDHFEAVDTKIIELIEAGYNIVTGPRTTGDGYYESRILGPEGIQIEITI